MSLSQSSDVQRVIEAARSPEWHVVADGSSIVCTRDSGVPGLPFTIVARRGGRGMKVSSYQPGDDITIEGVVLGDIMGPPRDMGRQLRGLLEEALHQS
jgi:hypothetical protein